MFPRTDPSALPGAKRSHNQVALTLGKLSRARPWFVEFQGSDGDDEYRFNFYKDATFWTPSKSTRFRGDDVCGLDWGEYVLRPRFCWVYLPPTRYFFAAVITRRVTITLLFKTNSQMKEWRDGLRARLYGTRTYLRQRLLHLSQETGEATPVFLHAGRDVISIARAQRGDEEPGMLHRCAWPKDQFYDCEVPGTGDGSLVLVMNTATPPASCAADGKVKVYLRCDRLQQGEDGRVLDREETVRAFKRSLEDFVMYSWFARVRNYDGIPKRRGQEPVYEVLPGTSDDDKVPGVTPPPEAAAPGPAETLLSEDQIRDITCQIFRKMKDERRDFTPAQSRVLRDGEVIAHVLHAAPGEHADPAADTLQLPPGVRDDLCLRLYAVSPTETLSDWTALADVIGTTQPPMVHPA